MKKEKHNSFLPNFIFFWLPALLWAGMIFYFSNQSGLKAGFSAPNEIIVRKIAHIVEFGVLGWLIWRIFHYVFKFKLMASVTWSFILATLYAISDEMHQVLIQDRKGRLEDVVLDSFGVLLFLLPIVQLYLGKVIKKFMAGFLIVLVAILFLVNSMIQEAKRAQSYQHKIEYSSQTQNVKNEDISPVDSHGKNEIITKQVEERQNEEKESRMESEDLPASILLDVPFSSQAPFGIWDDVHEEACEEMSLIMIKYYLDGKQLTSQLAEEEIQRLKEYQLQKYGHYHDSDMQELVKIAEEYYGIENLHVIHDITKDDLKEELAKGNPIIIPTAGRELGNPNFTQPGPLYHNLVVKGYRGNVMITNDPGTRKGEGFEYSLDILFDAIHDFPGEKEQILQGRKAMVVIR